VTSSTEADGQENCSEYDGGRAEHDERRYEPWLNTAITRTTATRCQPWHTPRPSSHRPSSILTWTHVHCTVGQQWNNVQHLMWSLPVVIVPRVETTDRQARQQRMTDGDRLHQLITDIS